MRGWIKLHRQFLEWEWYDDNNTKILFLHLLLKTNHKDRSYRGDIVKRGTLLTGLQLLSKETGLSVQQVRTSLGKLNSTNEITIKTSNKGTVIQVVKYDSYQEVTNEATTGQQTNNKQVTTNKKEKKEKKSIDLPDLDESKLLLLTKWVEYRKQLKKPLTQYGIDTLAKKIQSKPLVESQWVINHTIENGWQGLFWDKYKPEEVRTIPKDVARTCLKVPAMMEKKLSEGFTREEIENFAL